VLEDGTAINRDADEIIDYLDGHYGERVDARRAERVDARRHRERASEHGAE